MAAFLFYFALESTWPSLSAAPATVLSAGLAARVKPQAALRWTALAPLLARARALPLSTMAIMVTLGRGGLPVSQLPPTFKKQMPR